MGVKKYNPATPGFRLRAVSDSSSLSSVEPEKSLLRVCNNKAGRNNVGRITVRHRGGGNKRLYRLIDFKRDKIGVVGKVKTVEYDPNRTCHIALVQYLDGEKRYILAPEGLVVGQSVGSGDQFEVKPGARIATDGVVISGNSAIDNSLITGESMPIEVGPGDRVVGSTLNQNGRLIVRATRVGKETEFARITAMVISAQGEKAPIQRLADRISAVFVPVVTLISIGVFYFYWQFDNQPISKAISLAVTVLVIACPCALGLATPVAFLVASQVAL